ncbi:transporter [Fulvivirga ligni]|uniref:transporter n=1 Tax=Fulvivirga ligni TaxID=2904246 RepID=UPI001F45C646|nr:transporter [Fulvivirga ligni]UII20930.1 transporter [Fulvivirga ligni]
MKKYIIIICLLIGLALTSAKACDVCGCSLGGNYFGILPQYNKNFIGLRWSQAKFYAHMNHNSEYLNEEYSHDTYSKVELWGRFYVGKKLQVMAFVPYGYNNMDGTEQKVSNSGLGDVTLLANYMILNTGDDDQKMLKHTWMVGGGVKLPTGENDFQDNGVLVNRNFQLGTGSTDFLLSSVYTVRYNKIGFNAETGYKINTRNSDDYLFGNQFHASGQFFYWQNVKSVALLPNAGLYYESAERHQDGEVLQANTGGSAMLLTAGLETYVKRISVGVNYKYPLSQKFNSDDVASIESKQRWMLSVTYNF